MTFEQLTQASLSDEHCLSKYTDVWIESFSDRTKYLEAARVIRQQHKLHPFNLCALSFTKNSRHTFWDFKIGEMKRTIIPSCNLQIFPCTNFEYKYLWFYISDKNGLVFKTIPDIHRKKNPIG